MGVNPRRASGCHPQIRRMLISHRNPPSRQTLPLFLPQRHSMAIHSSGIRLLNQPESIYTNTKTSTRVCPSAWEQATYVSGRLIVKPRVTPGSSRANILTQVPVPKAKVGYEPRDVGFMPSQVTTYLKLDTLVGLTRPSDKRVANCYH